MTYKKGSTQREDRSGTETASLERRTRTSQHRDGTDVEYSLCATHYNNAGYLDDSVAVLAAQIKDRDDWEFILTDAGSTDGSLGTIRNIADGRKDVQLSVHEGANIGEGRQLAAEHAHGRVQVHLADMDAKAFNDDRIFRLVEEYDRLVREHGPFLWYLRGGWIVTSELLSELGGWRELPVAEERDLGRRALRADRLRLCNARLLRDNAGTEKGLLDATKRFRNVLRVKLSSGANPFWLIWLWFTQNQSIKPKLGILVILPVAWLDSRSDGLCLDTYDAFDSHLYSFYESVLNQRPELSVTTPVVETYHTE